MQQSEETSVFAKAGTIAGTVIKHVPTRGILWGTIGLVIGLVVVSLSFLLAALVLDRAAILLGYLLPVPIALVGLGAVLFFMHGMHRGAVRAALSLEQKLGLTKYILNQVLGLLKDRLGDSVSNLPLQQFEEKLKQVVAQYVTIPDMTDSQGRTPWVLRQIKKRVAESISTKLLAAYRAELQANGSSGEISLEKVTARVSVEVSRRLGRLLMSPLKKQLAILLSLYLLLGTTWWYWIFLLLRFLGKK